MKKLKNLYRVYLQSVGKPFTDKNSKYYLQSGFSNWLESTYEDNWTLLAQECGFPTNAELRKCILHIQEHGI